MSADSELRLVTNRCGKLSLVFEGKAHKLKYTGKKKKYWRCSKIYTQCTTCNKIGCRDAMCRNLKVTAIISQKDRVERFPMDSPFY
ncbi:hypothetical protein T05_3308 [Trichinella murrelli]|uniref:FLYWCH-type domain-containing protein n=1 Tax=Trichinella murrelli TaxID=144512 RepID=A0A0V0TQ65_9BILA|nr:hypothetical protein T05_3308 [Trichinella murrelli]